MGIVELPLFNELRGIQHRHTGDKMKTFGTTAAVAFALLSAPAAFAQDSSPFSGGYVGVQAGLAQIDSAHTDLDYWYYAAQNQSKKDSGVQAGVKAGYDIVSGALIAGVLAEVNVGKVNSFAEVTPEDPSYAIGTKTTMLGSARAKLGFTSGNLAAFATGGLAFSNAKHKYRETDGTGEYFDGKGDRSGYVLGFGAAYAVSKNASIGLDISRYQFGSRTRDLRDSDGEIIDARWRLKDRIETVAVSYNLHF